MKFKLQDVKQACGRLGCVYDVERLPSFKLETPNILFYTRGGCIPHLTGDVIRFLTTESLPLQISLTDSHPMIPGIEKLNKGLNSFIGLPEYLSYFVIQDPLKPVISNQLRKNGICIINKHGKKSVSKEEYMDAIEKLSPDIYVSFSDVCTDPSSGNKRIYNSFNTTMAGIQFCVDRHFSSETLKNKGFIASIVGGYHNDVRVECAKRLASYPVLGYSIDGLYMDCRDIPETLDNNMEDIISSTLSHLPDDRLRVLQGPWSPKIVLKMVKLGVDLFDTSLPTVSAEHGFALTFDFNVDNLFDDNVILGEGSENSPEILDDELKNKRFHDKEFNQEYFKKQLLSSSFVTNLHDPKFVQDFSSVITGCDCMCCEKYSKAYIHHLLETKELLALLLLSLHNLHHYIRFFEKIRETIQLSNKIPNEVHNSLQKLTRD